MTPAVAIVGMACQYPDSDSPEQLWQTVLHQRRAFRRLPAIRLRLADVHSPDPAAADRTYAMHAAVLDGWRFDRARFRVPGATFRTVDLTHWLALDVASRALADAGYAEADGLPADRTGVVVGNTLTGEFSRAAVLRLRWPYVRRTLDHALRAEDWTDDHVAAFLATVEDAYKRPFPPVGDETLAGALSNTIAGRICNHYDLRGGGYTVDGACASSLLSVVTACTALVNRDLDVALAGGVDLSLDPFELVGFAKTGALAPETMRVYDRRSNGFWPGEGCAFVTLMRGDDALAQGRRVYATITGWGVSSDGAGGITRPEAGGQLLAVERAYARAGWSPDTVDLFEGHGTGTAVGDQTELSVLTRARQGSTSAAALGSVKANIGHTKAAAGIAGLLKATLGVHHHLLPPTTGCEQPHPLLTDGTPVLRVLAEPEEWRSPVRRAGVSAMGFGGINTHVVVQNADVPSGGRRTATRVQPTARTDCELFAFGAADAEALRCRLEKVHQAAGDLSYAELTDLSVALLTATRRSPADSPWRAAFAADSPTELRTRAATALSLLDAGPEALSVREGVWLGHGDSPCRVTLLFPGQGSPVRQDAGALGRLCPEIGRRYADDKMASVGDLVDTVVAQPAILRGSLAGLAWLDALGVQPTAAVGHSVGELAALCWAGCVDQATALRIAEVRGQAMHSLGRADGAMAAVAAAEPEAVELLTGTAAVVAAVNAPRQTVVSGHRDDVAVVVHRAAGRGYQTAPLPVSHAFHSPQVAAAARALADHLATVSFAAPQRRVVSTVTGAEVTPRTDLGDVLVTQVTAPVRFASAMTQVHACTDLFVEVGPGRVLSDLATQCCGTPAAAMDVGSGSARELFTASAALFAAGHVRDVHPLVARRFARPFDLGRRRTFLANPCESAPDDEPTPPRTGTSRPELSAAGDRTDDPASCVRALVAEALELPVDDVPADGRLLSDLHLGSLRAVQLVAAACERLGRARPVILGGFVDATVTEIAKRLAELPAAVDAQDGTPPGVARWVRTFLPELVPEARPETPTARRSWQCRVPSGHPLAAAIGSAFTDTGVGTPAILVAIPPRPDPSVLPTVLDATQSAARTGADLVLVQHGGGGAAFVKTLHTVQPHLACAVIDVPATEEGVRWAAEEAAVRVPGYREVHYDQAARRLVPTLTFVPLPRPDDGHHPPLLDTDVVLVTGGGKGIGFECGYDLARATGATLLLIGRSDPAENAELAANLARLATAGVRFGYAAADITEPAAVAAAVARHSVTLGPVTAVMHAAGINEPRQLTETTAADLTDHLAPKLAGLDNVLQAIDVRRLRLLVTFGSIIGRMGLPGEAHYAAANEWLAMRVGELARRLPGCRCLNVEWSLWSGTGMGARLNAMETLARAGVDPIPAELGAELLRRLLALPTSASTLVVTSRYAFQKTMLLARTDPPLSRYLTRPLVHYPGVELVTDTEVTLDTERYLGDHVLDGVPLLPAVIGLEAMAQAAAAIAPGPVEPARPIRFEQVTLSHPVTVPHDGTQTVRLAALARDDGTVDVALRSAETRFAVDHATARISRPHRSRTAVRVRPASPGAVERTRDERLAALYDTVLFHGPRFRRLLRIEWLDARHCAAWIDASGWVGWFAGFHATSLFLGDPGARDAFVHMNQCCQPRRRLLPVAVAEVTQHRQPRGMVWAQGTERALIGDEYVYDIRVLDESGLIETWRGLRMRDVGPLPTPSEWLPELFGPYLQRCVEQLTGTRLGAVTVRRADPVPARRREPVHTDEDTGGSDLNAWNLDATAPVPLGSHWQPVMGRSHDTPLCDLAECLRRETGEPANVAYTRVHSARRALERIPGRAGSVEPALRSVHRDGWVVLEAGEAVVISVLANLVGVAQPIVASVAVDQAR